MHGRLALNGYIRKLHWEVGVPFLALTVFSCPFACLGLSCCSYMRSEYHQISSSIVTSPVCIQGFKANIQGAARNSKDSLAPASQGHAARSPKLVQLAAAQPRLGSGEECGRRGQRVGKQAAGLQDPNLSGTGWYLWIHRLEKCRYL